MSDKKFEPFEEGKTAYVPKQKPQWPYNTELKACSTWWKGFREARALVKKEKGDV